MIYDLIQKLEPDALDEHFATVERIARMTNPKLWEDVK